MPSMVVQVILMLFFNVPKLSCLWILNLLCLYCLWIFTSCWRWSPPVTLTSYRQSSTQMDDTTSSLEPTIYPENYLQRQACFNARWNPSLKNVLNLAGWCGQPLQNWAWSKPCEEAGRRHTYDITSNISIPLQASVLIPKSMITDQPQMKYSCLESIVTGVWGASTYSKSVDYLVGRRFLRHLKYSRKDCAFHWHTRYG